MCNFSALYRNSYQELFFTTGFYIGFYDSYEIMIRGEEHLHNVLFLR